MSHRRRWFKLIALLLGFVIGSSTLLLWARGASLKAAYFMGVRNMMIVSGATKVEAFRVRQPGYDSIPANIPVYNESASGVKLDDATAARLTGAILDIHNNRPYFVSGWPDCEPTPGVAYRILRNSDFVDFLPCFSCGLLMVRSGPRQQFDVQKSGLLQISKELFPQFLELENM